MATCWICSKQFSSKTELNIHLTSKEHRRMTVICVFCNDEKTFTRPSDLYFHCTKKHFVEAHNLPKSFLSTRNCFYFAVFPEDYGRINNIEPWSSANAIEARRLLMKWVEKQPGASIKRDNWRQGWRNATKEPEYQATYTATKLDMPVIVPSHDTEYKKDSKDGNKQTNQQQKEKEKVSKENSKKNEMPKDEHTNKQSYKSKPEKTKQNDTGKHGHQSKEKHDKRKQQANKENDISTHKETNKDKSLERKNNAIRNEVKDKSNPESDNDKHKQTTKQGEYKIVNMERSETKETVNKEKLDTKETHTVLHKEDKGETQRKEKVQIETTKKKETDEKKIKGSQTQDVNSHNEKKVIETEEASEKVCEENDDKINKMKVDEKGDNNIERKTMKMNETNHTDIVNIELNQKKAEEGSNTAESELIEKSSKNKYQLLMENFADELRYNPEIQIDLNQEKNTENEKQKDQNSGNGTPLFDEMKDITGELTIVSNILGQNNEKKRKIKDTEENDKEKDRNIKIIKDSEGNARRVIVKNNKTLARNDNKSKNDTDKETHTKRKINTSIDTNSKHIGQNNTSIQRANDLMITGVMPFCPPGRRDWDLPNTYHAIIKGKEFSWPPLNWRQMTPDRKLLAWEFTAMGMEEAIESPVSPSMSRAYILDKFNFLALPGTAKFRKEADEMAASRSRFYTYQALREVASGKVPSKAEELQIISLEQHRNYSDDFLLKLRSLEVPLRLTTL